LKKAILILAVLIFSFLYYVGLLAKQETLPFSKEFFSVETAPSEDRPFDLRQTGAQKPAGEGGKAPTRKELEQLYQLKLDKGIRNIPVLSQWLNREALKARERGDPDEAVALATYAVRFPLICHKPTMNWPGSSGFRAPFSSTRSSARSIGGRSHSFVIIPVR